MKIERLSENQIRCTLSKSDLASRQLKISELAYGSEKAKELFRDMMQQASYECGFEADDIPLMIEAIPVSADCIILIVTKVDNPEELDTRFSRFSPYDSEEGPFDDFDASELDDIEQINSPDEEVAFSAEDELDDQDSLSSDVEPISDSIKESANELVNLFNRVKDYINNSSSNNDNDKDKDSFVPLGQSLKSKSQEDTASSNKVEDNSKQSSAMRVYSFNSLDDFSEAARIICPIYNDDSALFKDKGGKYILVINRKQCSSSNFNKVCNMLSEYGHKEMSNTSSISYYYEHAEIIIKNRAIHVCAKL